MSDLIPRIIAAVATYKAAGVKPVALYLGSKDYDELETLAKHFTPCGLNGADLKRRFMDMEVFKTDVPRHIGIGADPAFVQHPGIGYDPAG
jgi:hypothetical protein